MEAKDKADELVRKFALGGWGKEHATNCVDEILSDLKESYEVAQDLHPHASGLIAGSMYFWTKVKEEILLLP